MREIFLHELRAHRRSLLFWTVAVAALLAMVIAIQPSMAKQGSMLELKLQTLPDSLKKVFGLGQLDFLRPAGYIAVNFVYVTLTAPLSAALYGANLIAKEEMQHTAEILYSQPISRRRVLLAKAGALAVHVAVFHAALIAVTLVGLSLVIHGGIEAPAVVALFLGTALLAVCFAGLGMLVATLVPRARTAGSAALGIVLAGYLMSVLGAVSPKLAWLGLASPFRAVAPARIVAAGGLDPLGAAVLVAIGLAGAAAAILRYERRDLPA